MAVQAPVYQPTASQMASAATHLDMRNDPDPRQRWANVRIAGVRYVSVTSGNSERKYLVRADADGCECVWYERTLTRCSHMLAVELAATLDELAAAQIEQPAPTVPTHGARSLTDRDAQSVVDAIMAQHRAARTVEDLWATCQAPGCDNDPEPGDHSCYRHQLVDAF